MTRAGLVKRVERRAALFAGGRPGMAFKLTKSARGRGRAVNAPHLVALVRAGATCSNGRLIERPGGETQPEAAQTILIRRSWQIAPHVDA